MSPAALIALLHYGHAQNNTDSDAPLVRPRPSLKRLLLNLGQGDCCNDDQGDHPDISPSAPPPPPPSLSPSQRTP